MRGTTTPACRAASIAVVAVLGRLVVSPVAPALAEPGSPADPKVLRISVLSESASVRAMARVYEQADPGVLVQVVAIATQQPVEQFLQHETDLLFHHATHFEQVLPKEQQQAWAEIGDVEQHTIGWLPIVAVVHPAAPIEALTLDQLRHAASHRLFRWSDLGVESNDTIVHRYVPSSRVLSLGLFDEGMSMVNPPRPGGTRPVEQLIAESRRVASYSTYGKPNELPASLAANRDGIGLTLLDQTVAASGLKVLALRGETGDLITPTPANVASGRYAARLPVRVMVHPDASDEARRFIDWIKGEPAARLVADHHVYTGHVATKPAMPTPGPPANNQVASTRDRPIAGAVAVLPTHQFSRYFVMASQSHQSMYEQAIYDALARDGRLQLVDRQQTERLLAERELSLFQAAVPPARDGRFITADVFVLSHIVTVGDATRLRILGLHAISGGVLGELVLPIDPADPLDFGEPLVAHVARWWPGVLARLSEARSLPHGVVLGVTSDAVEPAALDRAAALRTALEQMLSEDPRVFHAHGPVLGLSQHEALWAVMGLSHADALAGGDLHVELHLLDSGEVRVRLHDAQMRVLDERVLAGEFDANEPPLRAWLNEQIALHEQTQHGHRADPHARQRWAREQARREFDLARQIGEQYRTLIDQSRITLPPDEAARRIERERMDASIGQLKQVPLPQDVETYWQVVARIRRLDPSFNPPNEDMPPIQTTEFSEAERMRVDRLTQEQRDTLAAQLKQTLDVLRTGYRERLARIEQMEQMRDRLWGEGGVAVNVHHVREINSQQLDHLAAAYWHHMSRASLLDPTWEEAAFALAPGDVHPIRVPEAQWRDMTVFDADAEHLEAAARFVRQFPDSPRHQAVLYRYVRLCTDLERKIVAYHQFCEKYVVPNKVTISYMPGDATHGHFAHLLHWVEQYIQQHELSAQQLLTIIDDWAARYDAHPDRAPHSDFVRLIVLRHQDDKAGYIALLIAMQERLPDPQHWQWKAGGGMVSQQIYRMFGIGSQRSSFTQWRHGKRGIGDLPYVGYEPAGENHE